MPSRIVLVSLCAIAGLSACGEKSATGPAATPAVAIAPPADAKLAKLYEQTCKSCHGSGAGGAPITGDTAAWAPRNAQGLPVLLEHTLKGYKAMPPLGACMDCSPQEFEALIKYMAGLP